MVLSRLKSFIKTVHSVTHLSKHLVYSKSLYVQTQLKIIFFILNVIYFNSYQYLNLDKPNIIITNVNN